MGCKSKDLWVNESGFQSGIFVAEINDYSVGGALILLALFTIGFIVRTVWIILWRRTFYFEFQPHFILLRDGVISREEKHLRYATIQNVSLKQGVVDRLFGFATVVIENAASGNSVTARPGATSGGGSKVTLPGQRVADAETIVQALNGVLANRAASSTGL